MRAFLQRVTHARVSVAGDLVGAIEHGLLVYLGIASGDTTAEVEWAARKIAELRLFPSDTAEAARSMERSVTEAGGAVLLISQFTLLADTRRVVAPRSSRRLRRISPRRCSRPSPLRSANEGSRLRRVALARTCVWSVRTTAR